MRRATCASQSPHQRKFRCRWLTVWQGNGLGKMLAKLESRAAGAGIRRLIAETLAANQKLLSLARDVGFSESCAVRGVIRLEKTLMSDPAGPQVQ